MGPQHRCNGNHSDVMITDIRQWLNHIRDAMHCMTINIGTQEFIKHRSPDNTFIRDEQLHAMELGMYDGNNVQVQGFKPKPNISNGSMERKPGLEWRGSMAWLGLGNAMPAEVLWHAEWASPVTTVTTIQNQAPKKGFSWRRVPVSTGAHHNTWQLG